MVAALREAGRVAKPGAPVVIQVWGAHESCALEAMKEIARPFFPPRPPDAPPDPDLSRPGALQALASAGGPHARSRFPNIVGLHLPRRGDARPRRSSLQPASRSSSAPSAKTRSKPRSSKASQNTAPPKAATASTTSTTTSSLAREHVRCHARGGTRMARRRGFMSSRGWPSTQRS